jgi:glutathione S-transferase
MKLIGSALSPYAARVLIAARFKGIDLPMEAPEGGPRSAAHLAVSPIGKIPVLVDGSLVLPESDVILGYLEDRHPDPSLFPGDAAARANIRLVTRLWDTYSAPSFGPFVENTDAAAIATARERIDSALGYVDHFRVDGEFASGPAFSAADCALIPFFHIMELLQGGFGLFDYVRSRPRLESWWLRTKDSAIGAFARATIDEAVAKMFAERAR